MKYHKCASCSFNVNAEEPYCPDCGRSNPFNSAVQSNIFAKKAAETLLICGEIVVLVICIIYFVNQGGAEKIISCAMPLGVIGIIFIFKTSAFFAPIALAIYRKILPGSRNEAIAENKTLNPESFKFKEDLIRKRRRELFAREDQVTGVLEKARRNTDEKWRQVCVVLENTLQSIQRQDAKYYLKAIEIKIVRLQNELAPFVYETKELSFDTLSNHLKIIDGNKATAEILAGEINNQVKILDNPIEIKEIRQRLEEIQQSIHKLYEAFLGRQAVLALQDVKPLDNSLNPILPPVKAIKESEVFNTQVAITEFYSSFDELESEYTRIRAEEDIARQVDKIINETYKPL